MNLDEFPRPPKEGFFQWFVGFVDGEGCFIIRHRKYNNAFHCRLTIRLRDDDLPILLEIQEQLGMGTIYRVSAHEGSRPQAMWQVHRIDDVIRLIEIFDRYALRTKKQRDYRVWREAALEISKGRGGGSIPPSYDTDYLAYLTQKIKFVRAYDSPDDIEEFEPEGEQLELPFYKGGG